MKRILIILVGLTTLFCFTGLFSKAQQSVLAPSPIPGKIVTIHGVVGQSPIQITTGASVDTIKFGGGSISTIPAGYVYRSTGSLAYGDSNLVFDTTLGALGINRKTPSAVFEVWQPKVAFAGVVTSSGTGVTGVGTDFRSTARQGDSILVGSDLRLISSVNSNTSITVSSPFTSPASNVTYTIPNLSRAPVLNVKPNGLIYYTARVNLGTKPLLGIINQNVIFGSDLINTITTGLQNTVTGIGAGTALTIGSFNSLYGVTAGGGIISTSNNTAFGFSALLSGTGSNNTAIGYNAISGVAVGSSSNMTALGSAALPKGGANSIGIGLSSGLNFSGSNNIFLGSSSGAIAGNVTVTTSGNLVIGTGSTLNHNISNAANIFNTIWITNKNNSDSTASTTALTGFNTTAPNSTVQINGSFARGYVAKTGTYMATSSDFLIDCTSGTFTVTLPTAANITGRSYKVVNSGSGTITIGTTSSQTFVNINATPTTLTLAPVGAGAIVEYEVTSNGANWIVTGKVKNE